MQINLNPTSERGASRDAVNRPRETFGDSHLISSDPRSRFGLVCDLLCCRDNITANWYRSVCPSGSSPELIDPVENSSRKWGMVQTQVTAQGWLRASAH